MKITRMDIGAIINNKEKFNNNFNNYIEDMLDNGIFAVALRKENCKINRNEYYKVNANFPNLKGAIVKIDQVYIALSDYNEEINIKKGEFLIKCHTVAIRKGQRTVSEINIFNDGIHILNSLK